MLVSTELKLEKPQHIQLQVSGRVQGVGFRPFVYQLATHLNLSGTVCNTANGVTIHLLGLPAELAFFEQQLNSQKPIHATINSIAKHTLAVTEYDGFQIIQSQPDSLLNQTKPTLQTNQISPDIAVCLSCLDEFNDPENRRHLDPFINCSDCGPRFTIMHQLPYDRQYSSMQDFRLCESCQKEYADPLNRRYHTQGICCPQCGPKISLYDGQQTLLAEGLEAVKQVAECLKQAGLVAFKGVGGFHIFCDATNELAVAKLRLRKRRSHKPLAVLCKDLAMAKTLADLSQYEEALLTSPAQPIVLVNKKNQQNQTELKDLIAPDTHRLGLMLAYTPLQHLLFQFFEQPLIASSANIAGEPILYQSQEIFEKLCRADLEIVDRVLDFNRDIVNPCDDSIVQSIADKTLTLRLARGLAPYYGTFSGANNGLYNNQLKRPLSHRLLAVGAQQKSSFAIAQDGQWLLSPYIGELNTLAGVQRFQQTLQRIGDLTKFKSERLLCDAHPHYASREWAEKQAIQNDLPLDKIQHHYAHALACMAEFNLTEPVLAFCWDGSGLGDDNTLWGGEVLLANTQDYQRIFQLKSFKLLGGDLANQQPRRIALALLFEQFNLQQILALNLASVKAFSSLEITQLYQVYQQNINTPLSSSIGRLVDGVASLLGLVQHLDYEGQSGLLLESLYDPKVLEAYDFEIIDSQIDIRTMLKAILHDLQQGVSQREISSRFMNMLINMIELIADQYAHLPVVVSGGVFQNKTLLSLLVRRFQSKKQRLYFQQNTPINDGSIALGQLWSSIYSQTEKEKILR